jgi:hypothetical protein
MLLQRLMQAASPEGARSGSPPSFAASRVTVGMGPAEFALTIGMTRQVIDQATGQPSATPGVEWLASYLFSPITAKQLRDILFAIIVRYEETFGAIPDDPNFHIDLTGQPSQT